MRELSAGPRGAGADPRIDRPLFIIGTGRSGTTLLMRMMACHPDLAWFSNVTNRFPAHPRLACYSRLVDFEPVRRMLDPDWRMTPKPAEAYPLLRHLTDSIFVVPRELEPAEVTDRVRERFRRSVHLHLRWQGKPRFLHKHTGFPRIAYLSKIFPDARFVHVLRDGRAVASSLVKVGFWKGTMDSWWWGPMDPAFEREYRDSNESPLVLAGIVWKTLVERIDRAMRELPPERGLTIRYDALVAEPTATLARICEFGGLDLTPRFLERVGRIPLSNADDKWKRLPEDQKQLLAGCLGSHLDWLERAS